MAQRTAAETAARISNLDAMPESARLDIADIRMITGKSRATIYRWVARGALPKPHQLGKSRNCWTVGEIRRALAAE